LKIKLFKATVNDANIVGPIFDLYRIFYNQMSNVDAANQYIKSRLEADEAIIFFVKDEDRCIGFTQLYPTFDSVRLRKKIVLYDLFVCSDCRKKGVGKILMDAAKDYAQSNKFGSIELSTNKDNLAGQSLYESLGYIKDHEFYSYDLEI
jgi:ribosomal protein S18 acetylase RimI-like enzyme|tara:strand:- start:1844 stop:2290 length:447 start_codon:yes stop_codon:yes gene_type:complete